jgi:DNA polymerase III delta prime subunit
MNIKNAIWYEKYRPRKLTDMALSESHTAALNTYISKKEIPHILFYGPAGSGKTTVSNILIEKLGAASLTLNASSADRGVNVIKTTVKQFASSRPPNPDRKNIILFDEADGLTPEAQNALRNTIEKYQSNCRFIFTCNIIDKIIEPIISRCQVFIFESIPKRNVIEICQRILKSEGIENDRKGTRQIVNRYYPDVRSILNNLQACYVNGSFENRFLDKFNFNLLATYLNEGRFLALRNLTANTIDFTALYQFLFNKYIAVNIKEDEQKTEALLIVADYLYKDRTVGDKEINFAACCLEIMGINEVEIDFQEPF